MTASQARPSAPKLDEKAVRLWAGVRTAMSAAAKWEAVYRDVRRLTGRLLTLRKSQRRTLWNILRDPAALVQDLRDSCDSQDTAIADELEGAVWKFTAHAFALRFGDRVRIPKTGQLLKAENFLVVSSKPGDLAVGGRLLQSGGTLGETRRWISLLRRPWEKVNPPV